MAQSITAASPHSLSKSPAEFPRPEMAGGILAFQFSFFLGVLCAPIHREPQEPKGVPSHPLQKGWKEREHPWCSREKGTKMSIITSIPGLPVPVDYEQRHAIDDDCPRHTCTSQCDDCHTHENCVPGYFRFGDLLLCRTCFDKRKEMK